MSVYLERLRAGIGADYDLMDELASGGMGVVYRARDRSLDRLVAIKIIRPELATASARERFLREARVLASFSHPNIVPVHRAGETDGIAYYVMDYLEGQTLAERLRRGPLSPDEFRMVAGDLLAALEVVHRHGVIHRDVKPSNIFLTAERVVLSDFGISKPTSGEHTGLTAPGNIVGTPGYMPPEQLAGTDVTERTDVCAAGMVLYEACTGRPWNFDSHTEQADWNGVPPFAAPAIRRALAWAPGERWASAAAFRGALMGQARPRGRLLAGTAAALAGIALYLWISPPALHPASRAGAPVRVAVHPFTGAAGLGDSLAAQLVQELRAAPDIEFRLAAAADTTRPEFEVVGSVDRVGDSLDARIQVTGGGGVPFSRRATGHPMAVLDSLGRGLLLGIWRSQDTSFIRLPVSALPTTIPGMAAWSRAEAAYASAHWTEAGSAYAEAVSVDPTCALCELRLMIVSRWLRRPSDTALTRRVLSAVDRFTPPYRQLVLAGVDTTNRWGALDNMVAAAPEFALGQFVYGDELFHRGALAARERGDAMIRFRRAISLEPRFAPAWQHLAWVAIAEGERGVADTALATYERLGAADDPETFATLMLLRLGYAWRFMPAEAAALTAQGVQDPRIAGFGDLQLGPRYLSVFDAPRGVVWLGQAFERWTAKPELRTPGLVAQIAGQLALGAVDSAREVIARLRDDRHDPEHWLAAGEIETAIVLFDSLDAAQARPRLDSLLAPFTDEAMGSAAQRRRAAWMLTLLARRARVTAPPAWRSLMSGESGLRPFTVLLDADSVGHTDPRRAVRMTEPLLALDSAGAAGDPFFRSALHLMRAQWQADANNLTAAIGSLMWHENYDLVGHFEGLFEAADADEAFGTLGRWNRARLLERTGARGREVCDAFGGVARLWADGDARYRARAAEARDALRRLGCPST